LQWDGEIYNRKKLLEKLKIPRNSLDPILVLKGWHTGGLSFLLQINGPFAMALWDLKEQTCLLARGAHGLRPLYWFESQDGIAFAQNLPALFRCPWVSREPNWESIPEYLVYDHIAGGQTFYRGVNELLPGEVLSFSWRKAKLMRNSIAQGLPTQILKIDDQSLINTTEVQLRTATERLWDSDPSNHTALFLSGGVDSTLLAQSLRPLSHRISCLTVTCPGFKHDESAYAKAVRERLHLPGLEIPLDADAFAVGWWESIERLQTPLTSTNQVPWWLLCKEASRNNWRIVYAGEGADGWLAGGLYEEELESISQFWPREPEKAASLILSCKTHVLNDPKLIGAILTVPLNLRPRRVIWEQIRQLEMDRPLEDLATLYHVRTTGHRLLTRADLVSACHGVRLRLPYLEDGWLRWSLSIPYNIRNAGHVRKWPLKALCASRWGADFAFRKKTGFPFPIRTWIQEGRNRTLKSWGAMLTDNVAQARGLYRTAALKREVCFRLGGKKRPADWLLWSLINLELWLRNLEGL
jgi:asparagine synthase (glutamine-hydrolysing)